MFIFCLSSESKMNQSALSGRDAIIPVPEQCERQDLLNFQKLQSENFNNAKLSSNYLAMWASWWASKIENSEILESSMTWWKVQKWFYWVNYSFTPRPFYTLQFWITQLSKVASFPGSFPAFQSHNVRKTESLVNGCRVLTTSLVDCIRSDLPDSSSNIFFLMWTKSWGRACEKGWIQSSVYKNGRRKPERSGDVRYYGILV